ncbi:YcnI family copper-binding membrane protein [Desertihabitans aurantiacus]|uniref:YcnI family copper-binding membrane protein n=1 Tax=Desertihabitans aurantiacus TaxID=2282477 RepID=UPI000DF8414D|nr:YcnI family protein [Desertihabitans aurantiacus]
MPNRRRATLPVLALLAGTGLWAGVAGTASAHVTVSGSSATAGGYSTLTFAFSHGCGDSPTTGLTVQVPEGIDAAAPQLKPGWDVEKVMVELDPPVTDSHGNQLTERVGELRFTPDEPVPNGYLETFQVSLQLPADAAGTTLAFPTVQTCEQGENAWVQVAADGQDPDALDSPAPTLEITGGAADAPDGSGGNGADAEAGDTTDPAATAATSDGSGLGVGLGTAGLVAGLAGLATGLTALILAAKKRA